jgi:signal peptidase I
MFFKKKKKVKKPFKEEFPSLLAIIFAVLAFRSVLFEPFKIPTGSMIPTLLIGDYILVNKFSYGFKVPFSDWFSDPIYITGPKYPKHGDIIVFKYPKETSVNYIKRVVAVPGDTVEVKDKIVYINDIPYNTKPIDGKEIMDDMDEKFKYNSFEFFETTTGEHKHVTQNNTDLFYSANYPKVTIPKDMFFAMGDNRDHSSDSRVWGFVPFANIKGEALFVWFSMTLPFNFPWEEDLDHPLKFRPWRIGTVLN